MKMTSRLRTLAVAVALGATLGAPVAAGAAPTVSPSAGPNTSASVKQAAALPTVNMEKVLLAAQLDPARPSTGFTAGAKDHVLRVERALRAKGLLERRHVDGHFGTATRTAWRAWERRVHDTNQPWESNGLPGWTELNKLGSGRFTIVRPVLQGGWVSVNGEQVTERTRAMFRRAEKISGTDMTITQGRGNASASASTHLGGGVIDIRTWDAEGKVDDRVRALRKVGFAAWYRNWDGNKHIHAVAVNDPFIAYGAHAELCQVYQHRFGGEGLSCSNSVAGQDRPLVTWESFKRSQ